MIILGESDTGIILMAGMRFPREYLERIGRKAKAVEVQKYRNLRHDCFKGLGTKLKKFALQVRGFIDEEKRLRDKEYYKKCGDEHKYRERVRKDAYRYYGVWRESDPFSNKPRYKIKFTGYDSIDTGCYVGNVIQTEVGEPIKISKLEESLADVRTDIPPAEIFIAYII